MRSWLRELLGLAFVASLCGPAWAESRLAFVVGIDSYPHLPAEAQLQRAVTDADAVGNALQGLGFRVTRVTQDGSLDTILTAFDRFTQSIEPGDTVLFYYAGHGISLDDGNYLIPSDVPVLGPNDERVAKRHAIAEREVKQSLRAAGARVAIVVLDACRDNPFPARGTRSIGTATRGLARIDATDGVYSLYSAREGQTALDRLSDTDTDPDSVFTRVFLKELKTPGLSLSELGDEVRDEVATLTRADGHDQVPAVSNDLIGARSVYLAGRAPAPPAAVSPPAESVQPPQPPPAVVAPKPPEVAALETAPVVPPVPPTPAPDATAGPPASFEEADRLTAAIEAHLGAPPPGEAGRVFISPYRDGYQASVRVKPVLDGLALAKAMGLTFDPTTQTLALTPQGEAWTIAATTVPALVAHFGENRIALRADTTAFDALFDPSRPLPPRVSLTQRGLTVDLVTPSAVQRQNIGQSTLTEASVEDAAGSTSADLHYGLADLSSHKVPGATASTGQFVLAPDINVTAASAAIDTHIDKLRLKSLLALVAFFQAHPTRPDPAVSTAVFQQLKDLMRDALPGLSGLKQTVRAENLSIAIGDDHLAVGTIALDVDLKNVQSSGYAIARVLIDGVAVQGRDVPAWAQDLIPTHVDVAPIVSGFHVAEAARAIVESIDVVKGDFGTPPNERFQALAFPQGGLQAMIPPSRITSKLLDIRFDGQIDNLPSPPVMLGWVSSKGPPTGHLRVTATGIDQAITRLGSVAGTDSSAASMLQKFTYLRSLAKPGQNGALVWDLDMAGGKLLANGQEMR